MVSAGVRRVADEAGRLEAGRELLRRLAPGLVLAVDAVRGLAAVPFLTAPAFFAPPAFGARALLTPAVPPLAVLAFAGPELTDRPAFAVLGLALTASALTVFALTVPALTVPAFDVPDLTDVRGLADVVGLVAAALAVTALAGPGFDRAGVRGLLAAVFAGRLALRAADRAEAGLRPGLAAPARFALAVTGRGDAAGPATDIVLAAVVRALAAVPMALVAAFMDCIAVDIVLADEVARVAAAVILVAAEVTLVAADDTVRAAAADVGLARAEEVRAVPRALFTVVPALLAGLAARRAVLLRAGFAAVPRADDLVPAARGAAVVVGRPAERLAALVLTDRVLPELAGLRRAGARVVVCTGTDFPPS